MTDDATTPDDDVRAALRDLPPDLPDVPDRLDRVRRLRDRHRRRRLAGRTALAVAATVVLLAGAGVVRLGLGLPLLPTMPVAPARDASSCPAQYGPGSPWVPGSPSVPDGGKRMVPEAPPTAALLCRYGPRTDSQVFGDDPGLGPAALSGSARLAGGLDALAADLTWLPEERLGAERVCTAMGGPTTYYLLGLTYPDGVVWVSGAKDPNGCDQSWNGRFASSANLGGRLEASYERRAWAPVSAGVAAEALEAAGPCWGGGDGRRGDESTVVPPGATSLRVCRVSPAASGWSYRSVDRPDRVGEAVRLVNGLDRHRSDDSCQLVDPDLAGDWFQLQFGYETGPSIVVRVDPNCRPGVMSGRWAIDDPGPVAALAQSLLGS